MKQIALCVFFISSYLISINTIAQYNFVINGYIDNKIEPLGKSNLKDGDTIILRFLNISKSDTTYIKDGKFIIKDQVPYPSIAILDFKYGSNAFDIDNNSYDFHLTLIRVDSISRGYDGEIKTKSVFYNRFDNLRNMRMHLNERKNSLQDFIQHTQNKDSLFLYTTKMKMIDDSLISIYKNFAKENPNSYLVAYTFPNIPDFSYCKLPLF